MKVGDIVVYTPPGSRPVQPDTPRYVVVGVIPETDFDNELVWVSGISNTEEKPEEVTAEEAGDFTVVPPKKYCPICHTPVSYISGDKGNWWTHDDGGWFKSQPMHHDVNTYAPDRLLTEVPHDKKD